MTTSQLVYSTDSNANRRCGTCKQLIVECTCKPAGPVDVKTVTAVLRFERSGRHGKPVTVIDRLPVSEPFLDNLARELKKKCGCGGTYKTGGEFGVVEIQGDKREQLRGELLKMNFKVKG